MIDKITEFQYLYFKVLLFIFLILGSGVSGQEKQVKFTRITGTDNINLGKINAITQDKYGFIWLSAQNNGSIIRYDGTKMEQITTNLDAPNDPKALGGYYPECFFTEDDILWIGFYGQGLDRYDMSTKTFTHYDHKPDDPGSLASDYVTAVHRDQFGNLWIGTYGGLDLFDEQTETFTHHKSMAGNPQSLTSDSIRVVYEDKKGTLWIGTGMPWDPDARGGLNRYNRENNNFTRYLHDSDDPNSLINNDVRAIFEDSRGNFWVGTAGDGLHTLNRETGKFTRYTYDPENPNKLSRPPVVEPNQDHITFIQEDSEGNIWIGTDQNGINVYDPVNKTITHYRDEVDDGVWWMYISSDNQLWIATNQSTLLKVNQEYTPVPGYYGQLRRKYEESDSLIWFGTENGLIKKTHNGINPVMQFYPIPAQKSDMMAKELNVFAEQPVPLDILVPLLSTEDDKLLYTENLNPGIKRFDPKTGVAEPFEIGDSIDLNEWYVSQVIWGPDSNYWIGTFNQGLITYNPKNKTSRRYEYDFTDGRSLSSNTILNIQTDSNGTIWLATTNGIQRYNSSTDDFSSFLLGSLTVQLLNDSKGVLWAATSNGVFYYEPETDNFISVNIIGPEFSIFEDPTDSTLWFGSLRGVYKLDASRNYVSYFEMEAQNEEITDTQNQYWTFGESYAVNGKIYLGGAGNNQPKYYVFNPDSLSEPKTGSIPYFENLWLNEELIEPGPESPIESNLEQLKTLRLANDQNIFSTSIGTIYFKDRYDNAIYYKLEGFDLEWRKTEPNKRIAFFKIPTGKYTLRIRTPNPGGSWNEKALEVIIAPPFYLTVWAYIIYFLIIVALAIVIHRTQKERVLRKERERNKDRELAQAKEIEKAYKVLKETQTQLIQSEKMASLGELTAGIAHEIQNPLNFVNNFSEVSNELVDEMNEELAKGDINEAKAIASDIKLNLEKINHHGKRAESIVKGMLLHSRGSSGQKELIDINALADEYLRLSYHGFRAKDKSFNADFKLKTEDKLPKINVVPQEIGRVLLNLINNAFYAVADKRKKGTEDYKPLVEVQTKLLKDKVEIRVKDNGNGIPDAIKEKIFQPFFSTKPTGEGTGLGLSMSYDIITKGHNGTLKVNSEEQHGTEFIIKIPITS